MRLVRRSRPGARATRQCAYSRRSAFTMHGDEALMYDPAPSDDQRVQVLRAAAACPVQAIVVDRGTAIGHEETREAGRGRQATPMAFRRTGRIVIVGASLAGLRAAETLREEGFTGSLTLIGDEPYEPYDRPPLSKQVLIGRASAATAPALPRPDALEATGCDSASRRARLDLTGKRVRLADGEEVAFDRLLIATGVRARPWPNAGRGRAGRRLRPAHPRRRAARLRRRLVAAGPAGCWSSAPGSPAPRSPPSAASGACRSPSPSAAAAPLVGALGGVDRRGRGRAAARARRRPALRRHGHRAGGRPGRAAPRAPTCPTAATLEVDVAVVALGAIRNVEWLRRVRAGRRPVGRRLRRRLPGLRRQRRSSPTTSSSPATWPAPRTPLFGYQFLALEHWGNAVTQAEVAAHNMISDEADRWPHLHVPAFWSAAVRRSTSSRSACRAIADEVVVTQGSVAERRFVAVYGYQGRVDRRGHLRPRRSGWTFYQRLIEQAAPFPPGFRTVDQPAEMRAGARPSSPTRPIPTHGRHRRGHRPRPQRAARLIACAT